MDPQTHGDYTERPNVLCVDAAYNESCQEPSPDIMMRVFAEVVERHTKTFQCAAHLPLFAAHEDDGSCLQDNDCHGREHNPSRSPPSRPPPGETGE